MASGQQFVSYALEQLSGAGEVTAKKMFGEYSLYLDGKLFALIADDKLFFKPTEQGRDCIGQVQEAPPYPGAKNCLLIEQQIEDRGLMSRMARITADALPEPKPKKRKSS